MQDILNIAAYRFLPGRVAVLYGIFFVSGFCGLIYESIWSHYLKLLLGHAAYAQAVVLVVFVGGLAIGAWITGRWSERIRHPLLVLAAAEAAVAMASFGFHEVFLEVSAWATTKRCAPAASRPSSAWQPTRCRPCSRPCGPLARASPYCTRSRYAGDTHAGFELGDFNTMIFPRVDHVVACGSLSYRSSNPQHVYGAIAKMFVSAAQTVVFSVLDERHFPEHPLLVGHPIDEIVAFCRKLSSSVSLVRGDVASAVTVVMLRR